VTTTFEDLGVGAELVAALARQGINAPFSVQELTIPDALAGRDVCGKARTGSGKTLAFGLPILERLEPSPSGDPLALVLAPTRELAAQVTEVLEPLGATKGLRTLAIYGGAPMEKQVAALRKGVEIVVATPGRLRDLLEQGEVRLDSVEIMVLDEADRMADMGFMPQVEWILRRVPSRKQTLLFSATLDGAVDHLVKKYLADPVFHSVVDNTITVEEMSHRFLSVHDLDKVKVLAAICRSVSRTIVFCETKRGADRLLPRLKAEGIQAVAIHGDLRQKAREDALERLAKGTAPVLVATDVAARGIHIDGVDVVVHWEPTDDHRTYLHRSGRTARAGASGVVVTLAEWNQELKVRTLQRLLKLDEPIVKVFSNNPNLGRLADWDPKIEGVAPSASRAAG
jgi:superfamily II DNA/RNA helicase